MITILLTLAIASKLVDSSYLDWSPIVTNPSTSEEFFTCGKGLGGAFTIENSVYLPERDVFHTHQYNTENGTFGQSLWDYKSLFDNGVYHIHAIVPLSGFCLKSPLCTDRSWNEIENLVIVHAFIYNFTNFPSTNFSGFLLAERNVDAIPKFKLLTEKTVNLDVLEKLSELDLMVTNDPFNQIVHNKQLLPIPSKFLWDLNPKGWSRRTCLGAVFVPSRAEMLVLVNNLPQRYHRYYWQQISPLQGFLHRRKFNALGEQWESFKLSEMRLDRDVDLVSLISIDGKVHAVSWDSELFDVVWDDNDKITIKRTKKTRIIKGCRDEPLADAAYDFSIPLKEH